jgi:hypothetical protein
MAGSGDLACLRLLRHARHRTDDATYGTHMAVSLGLGKISFLLCMIVIDE